MTEIDEALINGTSEAFPRYAGDTSVFAPLYALPNGLNVGRRITGFFTAQTTQPFPSALQVFAPHTVPLEAFENTLRSWCDHAQCHPTFLRQPWGVNIVGRGYWCHGTLGDLESLATLVQRDYDLPLEPVMLGAINGRECECSHGRVIVPFVPNQFGKSICSPDELAFITQTMSARDLPLLVHYDFNGLHIGMTDKTVNVATRLAAIEDRFDVSHVRHEGMARFMSERLNIEQYPAVPLP